MKFIIELIGGIMRLAFNLIAGGVLIGIAIMLVLWILTN